VAHVNRQQPKELMMVRWHPADRKKVKEDLVILLIRRRFGNVPKSLVHQIDLLTIEQLNELGESLFDFNNLADLKEWLASR
jgi:hypothetical protein